MNTTTSHLKEIVMQGVFTACACISILAVALICIFLFANGLPTIFEIGPLKFLLGTTWKPGNNLYGILPMILGSISYYKVVVIKVPLQGQNATIDKVLWIGLNLLPQDGFGKALTTALCF